MPRFAHHISKKSNGTKYCQECAEMVHCYQNGGPVQPFWKIPALVIPELVPQLTIK